MAEEFQLDHPQNGKVHEMRYAAVILNEVLALGLALGLTKLVAGP